MLQFVRQRSDHVIEFAVRHFDVRCAGAQQSDGDRIWRMIDPARQAIRDRRVVGEVGDQISPVHDIKTLPSPGAHETAVMKSYAGRSMWLVSRALGPAS